MGNRREFICLFIGWLLLAAAVAVPATQNFSVPGLYYDEAVFAGMAKDFVEGHGHGQHMPNSYAGTVFGRPFPLFVQTYLGALKCWMFIPALSVFGSSLAVVRATNLLWGLLALLLFMLGTRRWLGLPTALVAGALLAFDPTYFFLCTIDWGAAIPSLICRCACLYFAVLWSVRRKAWPAFLVGLFAGLGLFNKADFAIFLFAVAIAGICCYSVFKELRFHLASIAASGIGFLVAAGPILIKLPQIFGFGLEAVHRNEFNEKIHALLSLYDGSHFYGLMAAGGVFEKMYDSPAGGRELLGLAVVAAIICFLIIQKRGRSSTDKDRVITFLLLVAFLITIGILLLPYAVRIHHAVLVFPLPQMIVGAVAVLLWQRVSTLTVRVLIGLAGLIVIASQWHAIAATESLLHQTGGRGRWSSSFDAFCQEIRHRSDLKIVSLDWGFNEQLIFLTDGPRLSEPFWNFHQAPPMLSIDPDIIYLAHPAKYSVFRYDLYYLDAAKNSGQKVQITPHPDRQNEVEFYTIQFAAP